jgi:hypothetical protein
MSSPTRPAVPTRPDPSRDGCTDPSVQPVPVPLLGTGGTGGRVEGQQGPRASPGRTRPGPEVPAGEWGAPAEAIRASGPRHTHGVTQAR